MLLARGTRSQPYLYNIAGRRIATRRTKLTDGLERFSENCKLGRLEATSRLHAVLYRRGERPSATTCERRRGHFGEDSGGKILRSAMARLHTKMHSALDEDGIKRLRAVNVNTVFDFFKYDDGKLTKLLEKSFKDVQEFKEHIIANFGGKIQTGPELLALEESNIVSTGVSSLDELLKGGLHPGELYEFCGLSSSGKTQICQSLAINVILRSNGIVHYIDTKGDFSARRIQMILEAQHHDDETAVRIMNQIHVTRVRNIYELLSVLHALAKSLKTSEKEKPSMKLVIIDSLYSLILVSSEDSKSLYLLNHVANVSRFLANEYNISVVTVNLVKEWRDVDGFRSSITEKPVVVTPTLGKFWLQVPNTRLLVEKLENEERKISVWKSYDLELGTSCFVQITDSGVTQLGS